jgi:hypothetical protein
VPRSLETSQTRNAVESADLVCPRFMTTSSPVGCEVEDRPGNLVCRDGTERSTAANASSAPPCSASGAEAAPPMPALTRTVRYGPTPFRARKQMKPGHRISFS